MAYYLQMDGVDDKIQAPSITFDKIEFEILISSTQVNSTYTLVDARTGSGLYESGYYTGFSAKLNGVSNTSTMSTFPKDQRINIELTTVELKTDDVNIFQRNNNTNFMKGNIYFIKFYNGTTLVAHYDMTTQTVQDQSGNGKHATLAGGTWVDDGTGGAGNAYTASLSDSVSFSESFTKVFQGYKSLSDSVISSDTISKSLIVAVIDTVTSGENLQTIQGNGLNLSDSISISDAIYKSLSKVQSDSVMTSETESEASFKQLVDLLGQSDSIIATKGKAVVLSDSLFVADSLEKTVSRFKSLNDSFALSDSLTKQSAQSLRLYDVVISSDAIDLDIPNAPDLIGKIRLQGKRELYVYLVAKQELYVRLKGGLDVTAENQSFSMFAGDTKYISFPIEGVTELAGASVKWAVKKRATTLENTLLKTTSDDITIVNNEVQIKLNPADTTALAGTFYHEAELTDAQGNVSTVMTGYVSINKSGV